MHFFTLPFAGKSLQISLVAFIVAPSFILFGYNQAVLGSLFSLESWVEIFPEIDTVNTTGALKSHNSTSQGACNASFQIGCLIGALSLSFYGETLGRRKVIFIASILTMIGQVLQTSAYGLPQFIVGRVILGFAIGQTSGTVPVWQAESASSKHRGQQVICTGIFISTGYTLCNWIDFGFSFLPSSTYQWRAPLTISFLFSIVLFVFAFAFPESPRWLIGKGRMQEATESLAKYRGKEVDDPEIAREIAGVVLSFESAEGSSLKDMFKKDDETRLFFRFCLCMGLNFFQQVSSSLFENIISLTNIIRGLRW